jgi:hypothetical protein
MEGAMSDRNYTVHCGLGHINVLVREGTISLRGEREAVAQAAWFALLGKNELGEDVDKELPTRKFLMNEINSRLEHRRPEVYETFKLTIKFTWIGIVRVHG